MNDLISGAPCPKNHAHGAMLLCEISHMDKVIGYMWGCEATEYCDGCADVEESAIPTTYPKKGERSRFATDDEKGTYDVTRIIEGHADASQRTEGSADQTQSQKQLTFEFDRLRE